MQPTELILPPHSIECEQSVLGALLRQPDAYDRISTQLSSHDFYAENHRLIFAAIEGMLLNAAAVDIVTVAERMEAAGTLEKIGGLQYLGALARNVPGSSNIRRYADVVRNKALERGLLAAGNQIMELAGGIGETREKLDHAQAAIMAVTESRERTDTQSVGALIPAVIHDIEARHLSGKEVSGLSTGFADIDRLTAGLHGGDLILIAGRPSMGKSALAFQIAQHAALAGDSALVFSLEMPARQLVERGIASLGRVDSHALRTGRVQEEDWERIAAAQGRLHEAPLYIDETGGITVLLMRSKARTVKRKYGLDLIVIDYIQLMSGGGDNRNEVIGEISRGLKHLAKEMDVPVIALSQLNRECEKRTDKRPIMADLRDSGSLEQDADVIMFVYRDEYYYPESDAKGTAEILIRKQRMGPTGDVRLTFLERFAKFENYAGEPIARHRKQQERGFSYADV